MTQQYPMPTKTYRLKHPRYPGAHARVLEFAGDGYLKVMVRPRNPDGGHYDSHISLVHRSNLGIEERA